MLTSRRYTKPERPRPLKLSTIGMDHSLEIVLADMDLLSRYLNSKNLTPPLYNTIVTLCKNLKMYGTQLEKLYKDQLDRCFIALRHACRADYLPMYTRYRLLEVIELRAMHWLPNENHTIYYQEKIPIMDILALKGEQTNKNEQLTQEPYSPNMNIARTNPLSPSIKPVLNSYPNNSSVSVYNNMHVGQQKLGNAPIPTLSPGEILKSSGKFAKPARVPGKNLCKDEVVIRNLDSGKVMGLKGRRVHMIEELSETVISFQRVNPGARERLVQITGPSDDNIRHASQLIEDTIRRNASPIPEEHTNIGEGSPSSSHTSDDVLQNAFQLTSNKRRTVVSDLDEPIGEYRYTVSQGPDSIRITGTNLEFVKTAKLVLEDFFRKGQEFKIIDQDVYTSDLDASLPSPLIMNSSTIEGRYAFSEALNNNDIQVPSISNKPPEKLNIAHCEDENENLRNTDSCRVSPKPSRITYSRQFIVSLADNRMSRRTPKKWSTVIRTFPSLIRKSCHHLATIIATMNDLGDDCMNECESYLQDCDLYFSGEFLQNTNINWRILRKSSIHEEDDNGNQ